MNRCDRFVGFRWKAWVCCVLLSVAVTQSHAGDWKKIETRIGSKDSIIIGHPSGSILFSKNEKKLLIPASTLKILTALTAIHHLGSNFRFQTEFYTGPLGNLKIKGYGDPLLISEVIRDIADRLAKRIGTYKDLVLDDTYFTHPLTIPGITSSWEPYDAPNGALCVNFNTVYFKKKKDGTFVSAEPQTPLLPYVMKRVNQSKLKKGRIIFSQHQKDITLYAGHMFRYFFNRAGIVSNGKIRIGTIQGASDRLLYRYTSRFDLEEAISKLMAHSNNFMANQILIAAGAKFYGGPGSLNKGVKLAETYAKGRLRMEAVKMAEGSGISRENRVSAHMLFKALLAFKPHAHLLRYEDGIYYKTGTLKGISTRAGYIEHANGRLYPFAVILNSTGKTAARFMKRVRRIVMRDK